MEVEITLEQGNIGTILKSFNFMNDTLSTFVHNARCIIFSACRLHYVLWSSEVRDTKQRTTEALQEDKQRTYKNKNWRFDLCYFQYYVQKTIG